MQQKQMNIELRSKTGKGISRQLRSADMVPGVVYGKGMDPMAVSIKYRELQAAITGEGGQNNLIHRINMAEKLRVTVPIVLKGTAIGVKEGGLLDLAHHELHVECLPGNIPDHIEIDITALKVAHSIHVSEIALPEGVKILDNPKIPVVSVIGRAKEEAPAEA
jgi:large subunit ribosomal protein L25